LLLFRYELLCSDCSSSQFCSCEFRLHFFTIHCSDNFALVNSDCTSSQFILQRTLLLWIQIAVLHDSFFRQFCSWEFKLLFLTIHYSENFALVNSDCTSSQFLLQTILLLGIQIIILHNSIFRKLCSCEFRFLFFTILSSHNFAQLQRIALHCSWEFCSSETDIKSSMFKSFHRYLLALPSKASILCLDSL
jgi:hypothetical protein